jgi:hypothetical protein
MAIFLSFKFVVCLFRTLIGSGSSGPAVNTNLTTNLNTTALEISAGCGHTAVEAVLERKTVLSKAGSLLGD